jgi:hypothetical protein
MFERLGWAVETFDTSSIEQRSSAYRWLAYKTQAGPLVDHLNETLQDTIRTTDADLIFFDKPVLIRANTVRQARQPTVCYTPDDPFGPRRDGVWRLFRGSLPLFSLHVVPRTVTAEDFRRVGAKRVIVRNFSFNPMLHRPQEQRPNEFPLGISFIGSPYDERPNYLVELKARLAAVGLSLTVQGPGWRDRRLVRYRHELNVGGPVWGEAYTKSIWDSLASLAFITRSNRDELSRKAIEIAASGRPPLVEPHGAHSKIFRDGDTAIFAENPGAATDKLVFHLKNRSLDQIGANAAHRVRELGMSDLEFCRAVQDELGFGA